MSWPTSTKRRGAGRSSRAGEFNAPRISDGREVIFRVLAETSVHVGHLDIVRELIDGQQNLIVS
ncbi:DUF664 domain-containing protein [Arthrobacter sp. MP_2.3]|uniref:mycothiol transferase n=1 Tax=Arthrobacter sp. MP_2.3 TaxID=3349633 RepID=UPI0038D45925